MHLNRTAVCSFGSIARPLPLHRHFTAPGARRASSQRVRPRSGSTEPPGDGDDLLRTLRPLRDVPAETLSAVVQSSASEYAESGAIIVRSGARATDFIVLTEGSTTAGDAPAILGLQELLLGVKYRKSISARTRCRLLRMDRLEFNRLTRAQPQLGLALFQEMASELGTALQEEEVSRHALQPYLVAAPRRGVIGNSRYAKRLRKQIIAAARSSEPLLFYGEPGTEKTNYAALVHFGSEARARPIALLNAGTLDRHGSELFGRDQKAGLLELVGDGTLVLSNVHKLPEHLLPRLLEVLQKGTYTHTYASGDGRGGARVCRARLLLTAQRQVPQLEACATVVKIAPLRVRPSDVVDLQRYFARGIASRSGAPPMQLSPEALRRLQAYSFPGNITELEAMMERAAAQSVVEDQVPAQVFWFAAQAKDRFRFDLLTGVPWLKRLFRSRIWPERINFGFTAYIYPAVVALLLFGRQDHDHNVALVFFWDYWWPVIFLLYPLAGRIWCTFCPFMIFGELTQRWRTASGAVLRKWPTRLAEAAGGWFLLALFAGILVWEEVWDLPNHAALSGWLLILITAGAVVCSAFFERRLWCRYLCPIGGMNGAFAKLAATEVRAAQGVCSGSCSTYQCYKGGPEQPPEGLASPGCPLGSHPAHLTDNADCVLCMECVKACPHGSVQVRLRPPLADLTTSHVGRPHELAMLLMLLGAVYLHSLPQLCAQLGVPVGLIEDTRWHIVASLAVLATPGATVWAADAGLRLLRPLFTRSRLPPPRPLLQAGYAYMPLVWAATLAFYSRNFLGRAGTVLQVAAATLGLEGMASKLPAIRAGDDAVHLVQALILLLGLSGSLFLLRRLKPSTLPGLMPQSVLMSAFTAELWLLSLL